MGVEEFLARGRLYARGTPIGQELPALLIVLEIRHHDLAEDLLVHGGIEDRAQHFNAPVEIARHHVGRRNIDRRFWVRKRMACAKTENTPMLEESADDGLDADILRQAGDTRPQAADSAHHEIDRNAGSRGVVEGIDDSRIDERVHLHPD